MVVSLKMFKQEKKNIALEYSCVYVSGRRQCGSLALYALVMGLVTLFLVLAFFFPQFFRMKSGIYRISCNEIRRKIETAVANYDSNNTHSIVEPGKPVDIDHLKAVGYLSEVQTCPEGGKYIFGPQGEILCTVHRSSSPKVGLANGEP